jgi:hypothetical protein
MPNLMEDMEDELRRKENVRDTGMPLGMDNIGFNK